MSVIFYNGFMNNSLGVKSGKMPLWKYFLYAMIGCFSVAALIGIIFILAGSNMSSATRDLLGKTWASVAVLGLFSLFTMNNLFRRESNKNYVKIASTAALVLNIVWVLPWLLIVWSAFDGLKANCTYSSSYSYYGYSSESYQKYETCMKPYHDAVTAAAKILANGIVLAIILTMVAEYLGYEDYTQAIKIMKYLTLTLAVIIGGYFLLQINVTNFQIDESVAKLLAVGLIILIFCAVVTPVLVKVQKKKNAPAVAAADGATAQVAAMPVNEDALRAKIRAEVEAELREQIREEILAELKAQKDTPDEAPASAPEPEPASVPTPDSEPISIKEEPRPTIHSAPEKEDPYLKGA